MSYKRACCGRSCFFASEVTEVCDYCRKNPSMRQTTQPSERTFTSEDYEKAAIDVCMPDSEPIPSTLAAMLRQGSAAEAALAEAQREIARLTNESVSREQYDDVHAIAVRKDQLWSEACDALAAERQKVTALRDYATRRQDEAQRKSYVVYESSYEQGLQTAYGNVIDEMDALGLTPAQPRTAKCPACGHKAHTFNECLVCNGCRYGPAQPPQDAEPAT